MNKLIKPDAYDVALYNEAVPRLDTGMTAKEAILRATNWWNNKGRHAMRQHLLRQAEPVGTKNKGSGAAFASQDPDNPSFLPSGILHGLPWGELSDEERRRVVKSWHHEYVRMQQEL